MTVMMVMSHRRRTRPTTHDELPGDDWGGDTSPRPGMREREREETTHTHTHTLMHLLMHMYTRVVLKARFHCPGLVVLAPEEVFLAC